MHAITTNPFDISFGKTPEESISRLLITKEVTDTFLADTVTSQVYIITGVRGSGKTVFMNSIANAFESRKEWIVVRLNPERDLLNSLCSKLSSEESVADMIRDAGINLSAFGLRVEVKNSPPVMDVETALERILKQIRRRHKRVLVTIDEVTANQHIREFCGAFQLLVGQELPIYLLMTGLFENIDDLQNEKSLTFLYRAPKIRMTPLNLGVIADRYAAIFGLSRDRALDMADMTRGYPFAFQALGYSYWNHESDEESVYSEYRQLLDEFIYDKIWSELSAKDKQIANGIAHCASGCLKDINQYLGLKPGEINQYRKRLIRKGLVDGSERGRLSFTLPLFEDYVADHCR